jgi:hypothetical protein
MSGPMSERAPDITVDADGRAESTSVLAGRGFAAGPRAEPESRARAETRTQP